MTLTFTAVYENGVLRPTQPLPPSILEGAEMDVILAERMGKPQAAKTPSKITYGLLGWSGDRESLHEYLDNPDDSQWIDPQMTEVAAAPDTDLDDNPVTRTAGILKWHGSTEELDEFLADPELGQ